VKRAAIVAWLCLLTLAPAGREIGRWQEDLARFMWSGAVTGTTARIKLSVDARHLPATLRVAESDSPQEPVFVHTLSPGGRLPDRKATADQPNPDPPNTVHSIQVRGLLPGREYVYQLHSRHSGRRSLTGHFRTFPQHAASFGFAVGSCARTGSAHVVFDVIREQSPLFFLHLGDMHYENIAEDREAPFRDAFEAVLGSLTQARLYRHVPLAYVWDDHDYGPNNSGADSPARRAARRVYREYVPHYELPAGDGDAPIYQAFSAGRARFILTDARSEKSAAGAPDGTILGAAQKAWFKQEVLAASRSHAVVFWASTLPWIGAAAEGADHWAGYSRERAELATFFADHGIGNLVILSGDAHMLALDDGSNSQYAPVAAPGPVVFQAAALDRGGSVKGGPYSHGTFPGGGQFGWVEVEDDGGIPVRVRFSGRRADGREFIAYERRYQPSGPLAPAIP
jgi:alkaline phosphatase D